MSKKLLISTANQEPDPRQVIENFASIAFEYDIKKTLDDMFTGLLSSDLEFSVEERRRFVVTYNLFNDLIRDAKKLFEAELKGNLPGIGEEQLN